jgi:hypothetical protein
MYVQQPVAGEYYINETGQLIKVRCVLYSDAEISMIMLQYQDGYYLTIRMDEWNWLALKPYSDWFFGGQSVDSGLEC